MAHHLATEYESIIFTLPNSFQAGATFNTSTVTGTTAGQSFHRISTSQAMTVTVFNQDTTNGLWVGIKSGTSTTVSDYVNSKVAAVGAGETKKFILDGSYSMCVFGKTTNGVSTTFFFSDATKNAAS